MPRSHIFPRLGSLVLLCTTLLAACADEQPSGPMTVAATRPALQLTQPTARPDRYLVSFKGTEPATFAAQVQALGGTIERRSPLVKLATVSGIGASGSTALQQLAGVEFIAQDLDAQFILPPSQVSQRLTSTAIGANGTDQSGAFFYPVYQWNIRQVAANTAWGATPGGAGQLIGILDTGIDPDHSDLAGRVDLNLITSFVSAPLFSGDLDGIDYNFHGTATAGYITTNGFGVASVAPDARLCSAKTLNVLGSGSFGDLISAINWAAEKGADVINMSSGGYIDRNLPGADNLIALVQRSVDFATRKGAVLVASAGNNNINLDTDPANFTFVPGQLKNIISVGATAPYNQTNFDDRASYSNYGGRTGVDLFAPGGDFTAGNILDLNLTVCSQYQLTLPFACGPFDYVFASGTSESAPHVAAAAAVVASRNPAAATPARITNCLLKGTDVIGSRSTFGAGRLNVAKAAAICP